MCNSGVPPSEVAHSLNNSSGHDLRHSWLWMNGWKSNISRSWSGCVQKAELLLILTRNPVAGKDGRRRLIVRKIRSYLAVDPNFGDLRREKKNAFHTLDLVIHLNNRLFSVYLVRLVKEITSQMSKTRYNPFKEFHSTKKGADNVSSQVSLVQSPNNVTNLFDPCFVPGLPFAGTDALFLKSIPLYWIASCLL